MTVTNTLAYEDIKLITLVSRFKVEAPPAVICMCLKMSNTKITHLITSSVYGMKLFNIFKVPLIIMIRDQNSKI
jgi:hypothetical protein